MTVNIHEEKLQGFSGRAIIFFFISLALCSVLVSAAIINRTNIERLRIEHLVLEKSLKINEIIYMRLYGTHDHSLVMSQENINEDFLDNIVTSMIQDDPVIVDILDDISSRGFSFELFKITDDTGKKEIISNYVTHADLSHRFVENQIQIQNLYWYLRVFPFRLWFHYPVNLILIFAGVFLSFLIFFIVQNNFELKRMRGVFENMARIDVLTGVYNRRHIEENLKRIVNTLSRSGSVISLLMIDVDFFKKYNDTYGHGMGDSCLKAVANAIAQTLLREEDFVARYGGEEFVVVLPSCDETGAIKAANRLLQSVRDCNIPHEKSDVASCVTVSVGATSGKAEHAYSIDEYLKKADEALYASKQSGRNKYSFLPFP